MTELLTSKRSYRLGAFCTICNHPERESIDEELVTGTSYRHLAARYKVSASALVRHKKRHLAKLLEQAKAERVATLSGLLDDLISLQARALALLDKAEKAGDLRTALIAVRELRQVIEAAAKLLEASDLERRVEALEQEGAA